MIQDLRYAWRSIARMPLVSAVIVLSLGVGIGVNTAVFSWMEFGDLRARLTSFPDLLAFRTVPFSVGEAGRVERVFGLLVSGNYFAALGLRPALGRFFRPDEAQRA